MKLLNQVNSWKDRLEGNVKKEEKITANEILENNFGVDLIRTQQGRLRGAQILVTTGGPHIVLDTAHDLIIGRYSGEKIALPCDDCVGLSDAVKDRFE
jgi:hypothetical protein